jgi:hypothetical protein
MASAKKGVSSLIFLEMEYNSGVMVGNRATFALDLSVDDRVDAGFFCFVLCRQMSSGADWEHLGLTAVSQFQISQTTPREMQIRKPLQYSADGSAYPSYLSYATSLSLISRRML